MTQLTQEHFDEQIKKLATEEALDQQSKDLKTYTDDQTTKLLSKVALQADLAKLEDRLDSVESTLDAHTAVLDKILRNSEHWKTEAAALHSAIQRHQRWFEQIAKKIDIDLES